MSFVHMGNRGPMYMPSKVKIVKNVVDPPIEHLPVGIIDPSIMRFYLRRHVHFPPQPLAEPDEAETREGGELLSCRNRPPAVPLNVTSRLVPCSDRVDQISLATHKMRTGYQVVHHLFGRNNIMLNDKEVP